LHSCNLYPSGARVASNRAKEKPGGRLSYGHLAVRLSLCGDRIELPGRRIDPGNTKIHRHVVAILLEQGRPDDGAVALMEGVLLTGDNGLRKELLRLYQSGLDGSGCATMAVPGNTALNPACAMVHRHLCAASAGTIRLRLETGRKDLAETMKQTAFKDFHCAAEELESGDRPQGR